MPAYARRRRIGWKRGRLLRITALGHAGLRIETSSATVLIDPWFSPEGAFLASWFQYPDNSSLLAPSLFRCDAVFISNQHLDHADPWFLHRLAPDVPIVIPRYPSPVLRTKIEAAGPRPIIEVPQRESFHVDATTSVYFVSEPPMDHDSAVVVTGDGHTLLNLNDARLFPVHLREIRQRAGGVIEAFSFRGTDDSWFPMCYRYPQERAEGLSTQKRLATLAYCYRAMKVVDPIIGLPFAGPPAFLDPSLSRYNSGMEAGIGPDQQRIADWLLDRDLANTMVLLPGDRWDTERHVKEAHADWSSFSSTDRRQYLEEYADRRRAHVDAVIARHPEPQVSLWDSFEDYFSRLLSMSPYFNAKIGMTVGFDITGPGGGRWAVDFRPGLAGVSREMKDVSYCYKFESRWLPSLLSGSTSWDEFFLSRRFEAWRDPDLYNEHLFGLLKFADPHALEAVQAWETTLDSEERIPIHSEGRTLAISRYCPHAGNDLLETGEVLPNGIIRCHAHHYEFELASGRCINGDCGSLESKELTEEASTGPSDRHVR
jgi:UDP-MurNAc hydroxylase